MFEPQNNPAYKILLNDASNYIVTWTKNDWYASSSEAQAGIEGDPMTA